MTDPTIRQINCAVLLRLQTAEGSPADPDPTLDALPIEADSIQYNNPYTMEASNEATGSFVAGAPLIIGQPATVSFKSRIKGAGAGLVYSPTVKPPLHQAVQACGWRGQFHAAIAAAVVSAGGASGVTLSAAFPATARALLGLVLLIGAGRGSGAATAIVEYAATRVAALADTFSPVLDGTTSVSLPPSWSYAGTSPNELSARATDHPLGTIEVYEDGKMRRFEDCRGVMPLEGRTARPGYATFNFTGVYAGEWDKPMPTNLVIAGHSAPTLVQATETNPAVTLNRKPLPIGTWSLDPGSQIESPEDPNTKQGFAGGQIVDRAAMLKMDPLATLVAVRNTIADIGAGTLMPSALRHGSIAGNRWALVVPFAQPVEVSTGTRGKLKSEDITLQCRSGGRDAYGRDTDRVLVFY